MSKRIDDILAIIDQVVERRYDCEGCGRTHVLHPDTSMRAKVDCPCGARCEFNLRARG